MSSLGKEWGGGADHLVLASIALGPKIADYLGAIVPPVLACFNDADSKVRYFACESMYNVVSRSSLLRPRVSLPLLTSPPSPGQGSKGRDPHLLQ